MIHRSIDLIEYHSGQHLSTVGELTDYSQLVNIYYKMQIDQQGNQILLDKPRVRSPFINIDQLIDLPSNTFGHQYAVFMKSRQLCPDQRPIVQHIEETEIAYVYQRYKEIHDFLHVLLFQNISLEDEIAIKWFEMYQLGLPSTTISSIFGQSTLSFPQLISLKTIKLPQILEKARKSKFIMNVYFEQHFETDLDEFKRSINIH